MTDEASRPGHPGPARRARTVAEAIVRDAAEWGVSARQAGWLLVGPLVIAVAVAATVVVRPLYRALVFEDGLVEWVQVAFVIALVVLGALIGWRLVTGGHRWLGAVYLAAAAGAVVVLGEEISWGQRIFGWITPDELRDANQQGETNLHNIGETLKVLNAVMLAVAVVAAVGPIVWRLRVGDRPRTLVELLFIPPLFLVPAFLFVAAYRAVRIVVLPEAPAVISRYQEVVELVFYFAFAVFALLVARRIPDELGRARGPVVPDRPIA